MVSHLTSESYACSITDYDTDTVILTGGDPTYNRVERYGHSGLVETLPEFNQGRWAHGCSSYSKDGKKVFQTFLILEIILDIKKYLVVGGYDGSEYLSSTEIFTPGTDSSWTKVSPLSRTFSFAGSVNLNNRIYLFGDYSSILEIVF